MHPQNFMIFGTYKLHNAENELMLSLCHYVNSYSPEGATNMSTFYLQFSFLLFFYYKFYSKQKSSGFAIW